MEDRQKTWNLAYNRLHIDALRRILRSRSATSFGASMGLAQFEISLPHDLGKIQATEEDRCFLLRFRHEHSKLSEQEKIVWIYHEQDIWVSARFSRDGMLANAIRKILTRPLWHFVAEQGRRQFCIFCNRPLKVRVSCTLGYGPCCAEKYNLWWND